MFYKYFGIDYIRYSNTLNVNEYYPLLLVAMEQSENDDFKDWLTWQQDSKKFKFYFNDNNFKYSDDINTINNNIPSYINEMKKAGQTVTGSADDWIKATKRKLQYRDENGIYYNSDTGEIEEKDFKKTPYPMMKNNISEKLGIILP